MLQIFASQVDKITSWSHLAWPLRYFLKFRNKAKRSPDTEEKAEAGTIPTLALLSFLTDNFLPIL
jgi:hypothetical protein